MFQGQLASAKAADTASVRAVLDAHCTDCRLANGSGAPLDLALLARDPSLVRPGNPDGSPAYTALLRLNGPSASGPAPEALSSVRTWIENLPDQAATCPTARFLTRGRVFKDLARLAARTRKPMATYRVLALAHVDLGCASQDRLIAWRTALEAMLGALAGHESPARLHPLDPQGRYLALNLQDLGWTAATWHDLLGTHDQARQTEGPRLVRADHLMAHVLRGPYGTSRAGAHVPQPSQPPDSPAMDARDRALATALLDPVTPPEQRAQLVERTLQLARHHLAPVNSAHVAAELGIKPEVLTARLVALASPDQPLLRQLVYATLPRSTLEQNWARLGELLKVTPPDAAMPLPTEYTAAPDLSAVSPIEITIMPDRPQYAPGAALELTVRVTSDCYLTLISIDNGGFGTVIFPNDFAPENHVRASSGLQLPGRGAGYRLRLRDSGRERIVALCTRQNGMVDGIEHNFERQRFQELGPYGLFLAAARAHADGTEAQKPDRRGPRRQTPSRAAPQPPAVPPDQIWRTGIIIDVR